MHRRVPAPAHVRAEAAPLRLRTPASPALWYALLATMLLLLTLYLVVAGARRTARAEERGDLLAELLLQEGTAMQPFDFDAEWQRQHLFARLLAAGSAHGLFTPDLELLPRRGPFEFGVVNKHYCAVLRPSPRRDDDGAVPIDGTEPLEALAWPRNATSPGHVVFFYPADAEPAYSRNLQYAYADDDPDRRPAPGRTHRRDEVARRAWDYRGFDDERWLLRDRPTPQ
jgi:hypothetical protein